LILHDLVNGAVGKLVSVGSIKTVHSLFDFIEVAFAFGVILLGGNR
jgi:hypothetical protein